MIIIALLLKGYKVTEIADELYEKYKNDEKYLKYKKAGCICSILDIYIYPARTIRSNQTSRGDLA